MARMPLSSLRCMSCCTDRWMGRIRDAAARQRLARDGGEPFAILSVRPHRAPLFRSVPGRQYDHSRRRMAQLEVLGAAAVDEHKENGPIAGQARASSFVAPAPSALGV